jgi:hypothetical protein
MALYLGSEKLGVVLSGSSSTSGVETCTFTIVCDAPLVGTEKIWYVDGSSSVQNIDAPGFGESVSITVMKNSIVVCQFSGTESDNITLLIYDGSCSAYFISGDASLTIM